MFDDSLYNYRGKVVRVVDGDTLDVVIDLGFDITIKQRVRLLDIDTPETFRPSCEAEREHGIDAKFFVEEAVLNKSVMIATSKDKKGKYGRMLAKVWYIDGTGYGVLKNLCLNQELREKGFEKKESYDDGEEENKESKNTRNHLNT